MQTDGDRKMDKVGTGDFRTRPLDTHKRQTVLGRLSMSAVTVNTIYLVDRRFKKYLGM
jgi:hypothetical protein